MIRNPFAPVNGYPVALQQPNPSGTFMAGVTADRPIASPAHLNWYYFDTTTGALYVYLFTTTFAWVQVAASTTAPLMVSVPASTGSSGVQGQLAVDPAFFYVCHDTNEWYRFLKGASF